MDDLTARKKDRKVFFGMTCFKCGSPYSTVRRFDLVAGHHYLRDYCERCFSLSMGQTQMKDVFHRPEANTAINIQFQQILECVEHQFTSLYLHDQRFSIEAYHFIMKSALCARKKSFSRPEIDCQTFTARELIQAAVLYAEETWGSSAPALLKLWGIETANDVGEILHLLAERGILTESLEDRRPNFDGLMLFDTLPDQEDC